MKMSALDAEFGLALSAPYLGSSDQPGGVCCDVHDLIEPAASSATTAATPSGTSAPKSSASTNGYHRYRKHATLGTIAAASESLSRASSASDARADSGEPATTSSGNPDLESCGVSNVDEEELGMPLDATRFTVIVDVGGRGLSFSALDKSQVTVDPKLERVVQSATMECLRTLQVTPLRSEFRLKRCFLCAKM